MQTAGSFDVVMSQLTESLYTRAQEDLERRRLAPLDTRPGRALVSSEMSFHMVVDSKGKATTSVHRYCAGHMLSCTASFESSNPNTRFSGSFSSDQGGGSNFVLRPTNQPIHFQLSTSFWHRTLLSVTLHTVPALPPGTVITVKMSVKY